MQETIKEKVKTFKVRCRKRVRVSPEHVRTAYWLIRLAVQLWNNRPWL